MNPDDTEKVVNKVIMKCAKQVVKEVVIEIATEAVKEITAQLINNIPNDVLKKTVKEAFAEYKASARKSKRNPDYISKNKAYALFNEPLIKSLLDKKLINIKERSGTGKTSTIYLSYSEILKYKDLII